MLFPEFTERCCIIYASLTGDYETTDDNLVISMSDESQEQFSEMLWELWSIYKDDQAISLSLIESKIRSLLIGTRPMISHDSNLVESMSLAIQYILSTC